MVHVPLTLDVSSQWWEIALQCLAHLHILASCYQTYGSVSPVQATYETSPIIKNLIEKELCSIHY